MPRLIAQIVALVALVLCATQLAEAQGDDIARGLSLVEKNCARCHAVGRSGVSPRSNAPAFRDLSRRYPLDSLAEALAEGIITGHNDMPEFRFPPQDISAILNYLNSISR